MTDLELKIEKLEQENAELKLHTLQIQSILKDLAKVLNEHLG